jgi:LPS-assembly lipoprotein
MTKLTAPANKHLPASWQANVPRPALMLAKTALVVLTALLTACGFHLRGNYQPPEFLHAITLRTPANSYDFTTEMRLALTRSNIIPQGGEVLLDVTRENMVRQTSTVDSSAKAAEYTLTYTVNFRLCDSAGMALCPLQSVILRRSYQYDTTNIVGKSTEEDTLLHELRIDAAQQIIRKITALKAVPQAESITKPSATPATEPKQAAVQPNTSTSTPKTKAAPSP